MTVNKLEECARAIHAEAASEDYTGDYAFHAGLTTLDGTFNLEAFARAVIRCLMEMSPAMLNYPLNIGNCGGHDGFFRAMLQSVLDEREG